MYGHDGSNLDAMIAGMLSKQGVDPAMMAALMNKDHDGMGHGGIWIILVLLLVLGRGRGGLFGGDGDGGYGGHHEHEQVHYEARHTDDLIVNEANYKTILEAIGGNRIAVEGLAKQFGISFNEVQEGIAGVNSYLREANGNIQHAIDKCCCETKIAIDKCCCETNRHLDKVDCDIRTSKLETDFLIEKKFCETQAQIAKCCCEQAALIDKKFCDQNMYLERQFCDIKAREDQREIDRLRGELANRNARDHDEFVIRAIREGNERDEKRRAWERCHCQCGPISATNPATSPVGD